MIEVHDAPIGGARNIRLNQSEKVELVDGQDRRLPFSIETTNAAKRSVSVTPGGMARTFRCVNNLSGVVGFWRISPLEVVLEEWEGQMGQSQLLPLTVDAGGDITFNQDDVIVPPGAQSIRISLLPSAAGTYRYVQLEFGPVATPYVCRIPPALQGIYIAALFDGEFRFTASTINYNGTGAQAAGTAISIVVSFSEYPPERNAMQEGYTYFFDTTNIAQATTYIFDRALFHLPM